MSDPALVFWTLFNVRRGTYYADPKWIKARAALWKKTSLHALQRQTVTDWTCLMICAEGTQTSVLPALAVDDPRVHVVFEHAGVPNGLPDGDRHLMMRCDSDDRLHPKTGQTLLENAGNGRPWLQFNDGYASKGRSIYRWKSHSSPFYGRLFEGLKSGTTWEHPSHDKVRGKAKVLGPGYFCVTLHDHNESSSLRNAGDPVGAALAERVRTRFAI
jgi:hypothetical protein